MATTRIFNTRLLSTTSSKKPDNHLQPGKVFANHLALQAIRNKDEKFPEGSVLVREKLNKPEDEKPDLLAVMMKRSAGFNPEGGDWEFLLVDGGGTKVKLRQKQGECLECHQSQQNNDFVYPLK